MQGEGWLAGCLSGLLLVVLSLANGARAEDAALIARGRAIADAKCARCHAIAAQGASPHKAAPPFREIPARYPIENLAEAFAEGISVGHKDMPEFVFKPADIDAILTFIDSLASPGTRKPG